MTVKRFWALIMVGVLLMGIVGTVFGADTQATPVPGRDQGASGAPPAGLAKMDEEFGKALAELIAVKVITLEQKDKIIEYFEKASKDVKPMEPKDMVELKKEGNDPISLLVRDSVINQAQAAVIIRLAPKPCPGSLQPRVPLDPEKMRADLQKKLEGLVHSKVITAKQKDVILKFFIDKCAKASGGKPGEEPRKDRDRKGGSNEFFALLVQSNVITQKQADTIAAISEVMPEPRPMEKGFGPHHLQTPPDPEKMRTELRQKLDELVSSEIITDKQKDSIIKYLNDDLEKMKNRQADLYEKDVPGRGERYNFLKALVKDGVISREQADIIRKAIFQPPAPMDQEPNLEHPQP